MLKKLLLCSLVAMMFVGMQLFTPNKAEAVDVYLGGDGHAYEKYLDSDTMRMGSGNDQYSYKVWIKNVQNGKHMSNYLLFFKCTKNFQVYFQYGPNITEWTKLNGTEHRVEYAAYSWLANHRNGRKELVFSTI